DAHFWAHSCHKYIFIFGIILLLLCFFLWKRIDRPTGNLVKSLLGIYAFVLFTSSFAVIFRSEPIVNLRNQYDSPLASFQFDRFFYLYPVLWYVALGLIFEIIMQLATQSHGWKRLLSFGAFACVYLICAFYVLEGSIFKNNLRDLIKPEGSTNLSWQVYYSPQQYQDAADYIYNETGKTLDQYRIGNVGLVPAVAIVNGFYTIDGYSSVYSLEYKHRFRPAIAKELEKNEANRQYFDEWGNRCYLFPSDYTGNVFLSKYTHASFQNLEFDNAVLRELGCTYLFAAGEIVNAEEKGYRLITIIDQYEYTYFLYIYEIL
ncbi:MAG: DUF6044 family protein, partial [Lachnospiraceae bacterium]|nr:DUF6044 family protein [Lachnospiraceae bacterium]